MSIRERRRPDGALEWNITNPERRNAIDPEGLQWIATRCADLAGDVVVLRGNEDAPFCSGFDLTRLQPQAGQLPDAVLAHATAAMDGADAMFVAAVGGYAIGAGVEILATCDLVAITRDAWIAVPAAQMGVVYHAPGLQRMANFFGPALIRRILLLGERIVATAPALEPVFTRVVEPDDLERSVGELVKSLSAGAAGSRRGHGAFFRALRTGALDPAFLQAHEGRRRESYASAEHTTARVAATTPGGRDPEDG